MPLTTQDKLGIGSLALQGIGGLMSGMDNSDEEMSERNRQDFLTQTADARDDEFFQLLLQALGNQTGAEQDINSENLQRSLAFTQANPLGAENDYRKSNTLGLAGLEALSGRQLARGTPSLAAGFTDRPGVRDAYSSANVDEAIRQRRIATAGLDPRAQQEIGGAGSSYASQLFGDLQANQQNRRANAGAQFDMINNRRDDIQRERAQALALQQQQQQNDDDDGGGFWKKFARIAIPVAAAAAAPFTGGGSLGLMALGAGAGAATGALDGGWRGAGIGAGIGGASGALASRAGVGRNAPRSSNFTGPTDGSFVGPTLQGMNPSPAYDWTNDILGQASGVFTPQEPRRGSVTPPNMASGMPLTSAPQTRAPQNNVRPAMNPAQFVGPQMSGGQGLNPRQTGGASGSWSPNTPSVGRTMDARVGGGPMTMNHQESIDYGRQAGPAMITAPIGASMAGAGLVGAFGTAAPLASAGALASQIIPRMEPQTMQRLGSVGQRVGQAGLNFIDRISGALPPSWGNMAQGVGSTTRYMGPRGTVTTPEQQQQLLQMLIEQAKKIGGR